MNVIAIFMMVLGWFGLGAAITFIFRKYILCEPPLDFKNDGDTFLFFVQSASFPLVIIAGVVLLIPRILNKYL